MPYQNEAQLYRAVTRVFSSQGVGTVTPLLSPHASLEDQVESQEKLLNGHSLHIIGHPFESRKAVDYVHNNIVPQMQENPQDWLILKEGAGTTVGKSSTFPTQFYFQELAKVFNTPYTQPLADITDSETLEYY